MTTIDRGHFVGAAPVLSRVFATRVERMARDAVATRGIFSLVIPGGSVAQAFLPVLASAEVPWEKTHLFWCDERAVPRQSPDSNAGLALPVLANGGARAATTHPFQGDAVSPVAECERMSHVIDRILGVPPVFDVVLLGIGEDAHVASLFPQHDALERTEYVIAIADAPKPPPKRYTLSLPLLASSRLVVLAAWGNAKRRAMSAAVSADPSTPAGRLVARARHALLLGDEEALPHMPTQSDA